jgi:hypothetical protein
MMRADYLQARQRVKKPFSRQGRLAQASCMGSELKRDPARLEERTAYFMRGS